MLWISLALLFFKVLAVSTFPQEWIVPGTTISNLSPKQIYSFVEDHLDIFSSECSAAIRSNLSLVFPVIDNFKLDIHDAFGGYDECVKQGRNFFQIQVHWPKPSGDADHVTLGKPPLDTLVPSSGTLLWVGHYHPVCLPSQCSYHELQRFVTHHHVERSVKPFRLRIYDGVLESENWTEEDDKILDKLGMLSRLLIITLIGISILSTVYWKRSSSIASHFNLVTHVKSVLRQESSLKQSQELEFINGYRTLYIAGALLGHTYMPIVAGGHPIYSDLYARGSLLSLPWRIAVNGTTLVVSANFVISGCLASFTLLNVFDQMYAAKGTTKGVGVLFAIKVIFLRALRTLPVLIFNVIILFALHNSIPPSLSGPLTKPIFKKTSQACMRYGWADVSFVGNILRRFSYELCLPIQWFVMGDMQLFIVSLLMMMMLYFKPRVGLFLLSSELVIGSVLSWLYLNSFPISTYLLIQNTYSSYVLFINLNLHTINHIGSYVIGILLGYTIYELGKEKSSLKSSSGSSTNGNTNGLQKFFPSSSTFLKLGSIMMIGILTIPTLLYDINGNFISQSRILETTFAVLSRPICSTALAFLLLSLYLDPSTKIAAFFRATFHKPIARISFSSFTMHYIWICWMHGYARSPLTVEIIPGAIRWLFLISASLITGFLLYIFVEAPSLSLIKAQTVSSKKDKQSKQN